MDDSRAKPINQKLIQMVGTDNQPFTIAEDDGFIAYSAALNPLYTVPERTMLSEMLHPEYQRVRNIIQSEVDTAASVYSERLFSEFGNLYEDKRSRLLPRNSSKMLFLHHNYPIMDKNKRRQEAAELID